MEVDSVMDFEVNVIGNRTFHCPDVDSVVPLEEGFTTATISLLSILRRSCHRANRGRNNRSEYCIEQQVRTEKLDGTVYSDLALGNDAGSEIIL